VVPPSLPAMTLEDNPMSFLGRHEVARCFDPERFPGAAPDISRVP
jgi:hypothetical protein